MQQFFKTVYLSFTCLGLALIAVVGHAGDRNSIFIKQIATTNDGGNTLIVNQSAASNSLVIGPTAVTDSTLTQPNLILDLLTVNTDGTDVVDGNSLRPSSVYPKAVQSGSNNSATITLTGDSGVVVTCPYFQGHS